MIAGLPHLLQDGLDFSHLRQQTAALEIHAERCYRILTVGRAVNGPTDIVACLERALKNLGHHVLHIDPDSHPGLLNNGPQGGFGPVYVRTEAIRGAIERFQPQFLILLAGGMTFQPAEMEWLKSRGIVIVGVTLSDPDVLESVAPFAGLFDFHTTNAIAAIDLYKRRGVGNTLYFPFGIDRSFLATPAADDSAFVADVICLGHAVNRPERLAAMEAVARRLSSHYRVRVYGKGWSLPGARVVKGEQMLQASRGGRIHVNFPATRAGFTNVKCGVFESVASGGLLVTSRFDEMARFFDYEEEIAGYDGYEELPALLEDLLSNPDRVNAMRLAAFERLSREHLYEYRWIALFDEMERRLQDPDFAMDAERRRAVERVFVMDVPPVRRIVISGFYGARNTGDDLILESIAGVFEDEVPGAQVHVVAQNPTIVEQSQGFNAVARREGWAVDDLLSVADALVIGGGGLWHDYTFAEAGGVRSLINGATKSIAGFGAIGLMARMRGIPFHVVGLGVGPLENPEARRVVREVSSWADSLTVRDEESLRLLFESGVSQKGVHLAPDVVYALPLAKDRPQPALDALKETHFIVGVNLRPWARARTTIDSLATDLAAALQSLQDIHGRPLAVAGIPMQLGPAQDRAALERLKQALPSGIPCLLPDDALSAQDIPALIRRCDVVVAMRLHACLLAHRLHLPVVGLAYDPKVSLHFAELRRTDVCLDLSAGPDRLARAILAASGGLPDLTRARVVALEQSARARLEEIAKGIAAAPRRRGILGLPSTPADHETGPGKKQALESRLDAALETACQRAGDAALLDHIEVLTRIHGNNLPAQPLGSSSRWVCLSFVEDGPHAGDHSTLRLQFAAAPRAGLSVSFTIDSPYDRPSNMGRFMVQVLWNGAVLAQEDMAQGKSCFRYRLDAPFAEQSHLDIRLFALRRSKPWGWNKQTVTISDIFTEEAAWSDPPRLLTPNPFMTPVVRERARC